MKRKGLVFGIVLNAIILGSAVATPSYEYKPVDQRDFRPFIPTQLGGSKVAEPTIKISIEPIGARNHDFEAPSTRPKVKVNNPVQSVDKNPPVPKMPNVGSYMSTAESIAIAKAYARSRISATQFSCLDKLWDRESSWYYKAQNPSSGAYGIPQALPGSKMAKYGDDWRTNPITQVKWGLAYISGRYGSACNAWTFFKRNNWY